MAAIARREKYGEDRRSRRTRRMLSEALVELMLEKRYDTITVQEIIDRANVGRSTFYSHFLDKEDLLQGEVKRLVDTLVGHMDQADGSRIIPSLELFCHVHESRALIHALVRGRAIEPVLTTMQAHLSLHVESRLSRRMDPTSKSAVPLSVVAQYVAGSLLTLFQWWLEREMRQSPEELNVYFMELVSPSVLATTGVEM